MQYEAVAFPGVGIGQIELDPIMWEIPGTNIAIRWYAVFICLGIIVAVIAGNFLCKRFGIKKDDMLDCLLYTLPVGFIGARLTYVLGDLEKYDSFMDVIAIWEGGLAIYGGIIFSAISIFVICKIKKMNVGATVDLMAIGLLIGQIIGRIGNFVNIEVYGNTTDLPWAMALVEHFGDDITVATKFVHPLFLYEMLWNTIGLVLILGYLNYRKFNGEVFMWYIAWYSLGRGWMELLRDPEFTLRVPFFNEIYLMFVVSVLLFIAAIVTIIVFRRRSPGYVVVDAVKEEEDVDYERQFNITREDLDEIELSPEEMEAKQLFDAMDELEDDTEEDNTDDTDKR